MRGVFATVHVAVIKMNDWITQKRCDSSSPASIAGTALLNFSVNGTCGERWQINEKLQLRSDSCMAGSPFHGWNAKEAFSMFCKIYLPSELWSFILSALVLMFMIFLSSPCCCFLPSCERQSVVESSEKWTEKDAVVLEQKKFMKNSASHNFQITEIDECCRWGFFCPELERHLGSQNIFQESRDLKVFLTKFAVP